MDQNLNYRHLYYFWVVAKEGGVTQAAKRLGVAIQTISTQIAQLEKQLGKSLLAFQGRKLTLTEAGETALGYADKIFLLGEQMQEALKDSDTETIRLVVGISDSLPKLMTYRLLEATLSLSKRVRLRCFESSFDDLLADLALHKCDVVLTDRPINSTALRLFSHPLGTCSIMFFGVPELAEKFKNDFPNSLHRAPMLMPTRENALRSRLDQWFERNNVRPEIMGEFEDAALMNTFGRSGLGLFPAPSALTDEIKAQFNAVPVGERTDVHEQFFAISTELKIRHPAVEAILSKSFTLES